MKAKANRTEEAHEAAAVAQAEAPAKQALAFKLGLKDSQLLLAYAQSVGRVAGAKDGAAALYAVLLEATLDYLARPKGEGQ